MRNFVSSRTDCTRGLNANFFVDITYNPAVGPEGYGFRRSSSRFPASEDPSGRAIENAHFAFKDWSDARDEMGDAYGRGNSANGAFADLLRAVAGKPLILTLTADYPVRVPATSPTDRNAAPRAALPFPYAYCSPCF